MEAVEFPLPLPANVVVSKYLGSDPREASGSSPYRRDAKRSLMVSECSSVSRNKKIDADLCQHENMLPGFQCEETCRRNMVEAERPISLSPKYEGKLLSRKSVTKLSTFSCSKRPKTHFLKESVMTAGSDDYDSKKIGYNHVSCTSHEKYGMVKQKHGQDGKRIDRKNFRASVKNKYDPFMLKVGFNSSDSVSGGNDTLGIYGLKSGLHIVTKHVEDLSLNELLDGSHRYLNLRPGKGKKASNANENIILSVKKACSILPPHGAGDGGGNRKDLVSLLNPSSWSASLSDCDESNKCKEELFGKAPCQANLSDSTLQQPKDILERLALPPSQDLDALILNLSMNSIPSQSTVHERKIHPASLPPFPWSFSHTGASKPGIDSSKSSLIRSTSQGRWFMIGSSSTSSGDDHNNFSGLKFRAFDHNDDPIKQHYVDSILQGVNDTESVKHPFDGSLSISETKSISIKVSDASGSFVTRKLKMLDEHADSDGHVECDTENKLFLQTSESGVGLRCFGNESKLVGSSKFNLQLKDSEVGHGEQHRSNDACGGSCHDYPCNGSSSGCSNILRHLPSEISTQGHSPRALVAAAILCEMASCSKTISMHTDNTGRIKWPKPPSQKTMKARKSMSTAEKTDGLFLGSTRHVPIRQSGIPSFKLKPMSEKKTDFTHMSNVCRDPVRWSFTAEGSGASPRKLERDHLAVNQRPLPQSNFVRPQGLMPSPTRIEKVYDDEQKVRKATLKASSVGGTYIKDWSRVRSKRL